MSAVRRITLLAALAVIGLSCAPKPEAVANGDDPIAALSVPVRSSRYEGPYWAEQRRLHSAVWTRALAYCTPTRAIDHPNCEPVLANRKAERDAAHADSVFRAIGDSARRSLHAPGRLP
ncbi:MAG: hypothetical protein IRY91_03550 [Gemmatimonadaceae bacterium]|nr:hypothetical protein [Gemmatimonadaceae bacterium]